MSRCFSCGSKVHDWHFTCTACKGNSLLRDIRRGVGDLAAVEGRGLEYLAAVQERGIEKLSAAMSQVAEGISQITDELCNLASILECGFEEIKWELQQQTQILKSIDHTLKNPSQTQAHEWRRMAEQLRERDCLDEAVEWFTKALKNNPLDYRTYVGLALTFLQGKHFDEAKHSLERSLPHAPKARRVKVAESSEFGRTLEHMKMNIEFDVPAQGDVGKIVISHLKKRFGTLGEKETKSMTEDEKDLEIEMSILEDHRVSPWAAPIFCTMIP